MSLNWNTNRARERHTNASKAKETVTFTWHLLWIYTMNCNCIRKTTTAVSDLNQLDVCGFWESLFLQKRVLLIMKLLLMTTKCHFSSFCPLSSRVFHETALRPAFGAQICGLMRDVGRRTKSDIECLLKFD